MVDWKLVREGLDAPWDLYNLDEDPTETKNLASEFPKKVGEMESLFLQWKGEVTKD